MYDIIGDIHGQASKLEQLLLRMGYKLTNGFYSHPSKKAIFVGDYIDRGSEILKTIELVKNMVENGSAYAIMGNHEMSAITYFEQKKAKTISRRQESKKTRKHRKSIAEYLKSPKKAEKYIQWLKKLPLFLDLPNLRVIHACWDNELINWVKNNLPENRINDKFIANSLIENTIESKVCEVLLNGYSIELPNYRKFFMNNKRVRYIRIKWWINDYKNLTYNAFAATENWQLCKKKVNVKDLNISLGYPIDDKPIFIGHYWRVGNPKILKQNLACVDYSAAKEKGLLVAYRFNGEKKLSNKNFISHKKVNLFFTARNYLRKAMIF